MISFLIFFLNYRQKLSFEETISKTSLKKYKLKLPFKKMIFFYYFF